MNNINVYLTKSRIKHIGRDKMAIKDSKNSFMTKKVRLCALF